MKIYKYWATEKQMIHIDDVEQTITTYGGSNVSMEEALGRARQKAETVKRKIKGEKHLFDEYEAEIREEILQLIDHHSAITRNRYGAQVLNTATLMILDIDRPQPSGGLLGFFKKDTRPAKEQIFDMVRQLAVTPKYQGFGFRIYETYQGARVIVSGRDFDPRAAETKRIMDEFHCDPLYIKLCIKQGCYRARLTPKPQRMNMRRYKVPFPREGDNPELQEWLAEYERESRNFDTCRFIEQVGARHSVNDVVQLHDESTGANLRQPLA